EAVHEQGKAPVGAGVAHVCHADDSILHMAEMICKSSTSSAMSFRSVMFGLESGVSGDSLGLQREHDMGNVAATGKRRWPPGQDGVAGTRWEAASAPEGGVIEEEE